MNILYVMQVTLNHVLVLYMLLLAIASDNDKLLHIVYVNLFAKSKKIIVRERNSFFIASIFIRRTWDDE